MANDRNERNRNNNNRNNNNDLNDRMEIAEDFDLNIDDLKRAEENNNLNLNRVRNNADNDC